MESGFKNNLGCNLQQRSITEVRRDGSGFKLTLTDGDVIRSRRVVIAAGIGPFRKTPEVFSDLSPGTCFTLLRGPQVLAD